jgi:hypothetical protein
MLMSTLSLRPASRLALQWSFALLPLAARAATFEEVRERARELFRVAQGQEVLRVSDARGDYVRISSSEGGELRRYEFCYGPPRESCRDLGRAGWYRVSDLEAAKASLQSDLKRSALVTGGLTVAAGGTGALFGGLPVALVTGLVGRAGLEVRNWGIDQPKREGLAAARELEGANASTLLKSEAFKLAGALETVLKRADEVRAAGSGASTTASPDDEAAPSPEGSAPKPAAHAGDNLRVEVRW